MIEETGKRTGISYREQTHAVHISFPIYRKAVNADSYNNDYVHPQYGMWYPGTTGYNAGRWQAYAYRHPKGANVIFFDGHFKANKINDFFAGGNFNTFCRQCSATKPIYLVGNHPGCAVEDWQKLTISAKGLFAAERPAYEEASK